MREDMSTDTNMSENDYWTLRTLIQRYSLQEVLISSLHAANELELLPPEEKKILLGAVQRTFNLVDRIASHD